MTLFKALFLKFGARMKQEIIDIIKQTEEQYDRWRSNRVKELESEIWGKEYDTYGERSLHARHLLTIGGTAAAAIAGFSSFATPADIFNTMTGRTEPFKGNYATRRGNALEQLVATRASELLQCDMYCPSVATYFPEYNLNKARVVLEARNLPQTPDFEASLSAHEENYAVSFITAQIDSLLYDGTVFTICECKTAAQNPQQKDGQRLWGEGCTITASGHIIEDDDRIPISYIAQVQWQLLLLELLNTGYGRGDLWQGEPLHYNTAYAYVACDIAGKNDIRIYKINRDEQMQLEMVQAVSTFLLTYLIKDQAPPSFEIAAQTLAVTEPDTKVAVADKSFLEYYAEYISRKALLESLNEAIDDAKKHMLAALPVDATAVITPVDNKVLLRRTPYKRTTLDTKGLANKYPDIYKEFTHKETYHRVTFF